MKLSEAVEKVIDLATVIREYWETELRKRHPDYPIANPGEAPVPPPLEEKVLEKFFASLPGDMVNQIWLIMSLGRGYFDVQEMPEFYKTLKENFGSPTELASLMVYQATLADDLRDGLAELKKKKNDVDKLPLKPAKVRK
jgi:hypothetical protein